MRQKIVIRVSEDAIIAFVRVKPGRRRGELSWTKSPAWFVRSFVMLTSFLCISSCITRVEHARGAKEVCRIGLGWVGLVVDGKRGAWLKDWAEESGMCFDSRPISVHNGPVMNEARINLLLSRFGV